MQSSRTIKISAESTLKYLSRNYGTEYAAILNLAREDKTLAETLNSDGEILAEVTYAIRHEMARTLSDIIMRRSGIGTLGNPGEDVLLKVAAIAAKELNWTAGKDGTGNQGHSRSFLRYQRLSARSKYSKNKEEKGAQYVRVKAI